MTTATLAPTAARAATATSTTPRRAEQPEWGLRQWVRLRWAVRGVLVLGVAASIAANILHARPHPVSQTIAAWPSVALLLTVELIARVPVYQRTLAIVRRLATTTIAGIAAWVSYWHMVDVAARYGETGASPYLLPLSVDGLIIVASISLVEISGRLSTTHPRPSTPAADPSAPPQMPVASTIETAPQLDVPDPDPGLDRAQSAAPPPDEEPQAAPSTDRALAGATAVTPTEPVAQPPEPVVQSAVRDTRQVKAAGQPTETAARHAQPQAPSAGGDTSPPAQQQPGNRADEETASHVDSDASATVASNGVDVDHEVPAAPRDAIAYWQQRVPGIDVDGLAERIGKSPRQVRRYMRPPVRNAAQHTNGHRNDTLADTFRSPNP